MRDEEADGRRTKRRAALLILLLLLVVGGGATAIVVAARGGRDGADVASDEAASEKSTSESSAADASSAVRRDEKPAASPKHAAPPRTRRRAESEQEASPEPTPTKPTVAPAPSSSPYGRFTLVGDAESHPGRQFGASVAIDGDVVVVGAPGFKRNDVACGAAYVFERRDGAWTQTQRIDPPRDDPSGFAKRVGVSGGRIVVFGGRPSSGDARSSMRSYVRGSDGRWKIEAEVPLPEISWDAVFRGTTAAVVTLDGTVQIWTIDGGAWTKPDEIVPSGVGRARFGWCLWLSGDVLAAGSDWGGVDGRKPVYVYRRREGGFGLDATLTFAAQEGPYGALARGGDCFVECSSYSGAEIRERTPSGWMASRIAPKPWEPVESLHNAHPVAADGDLVVIASSPVVVGVPHAFRVLQRRPEGWYYVVLRPDAGVNVGDNGPTWRPTAALSGRTAIVSTVWDGWASGRAWIFEVTDDDLARATKVEAVESDAK